MSRIGIYLRLSKEDEFSDKESNSISNQRKIIEQYIRRNNEFHAMEIKEYSDDGYSGKNMNRPGIQNLLKDIKNGIIQCVIVKDLSRFSRDHITLSQHMELIFPFMNVRFIAISDNYDSTKCDGGIGELDVAFKSLIYDFYSEDLSVKVKTSLDAQRKKGKFIATIAPYGYVKDPEDKHNLLVDDVAAKVIRRIFEDYLKGKTMYQIAQDLNKENVPSMSDRIRERDNRDYSYKKEKYFWNTTAISRILHNEYYDGTMVYGKTPSKAVGSKKKDNRPRDQWKMVPEAVPRIVDKEVYEAVEEKLKGNSKVVNAHEKHILKGKVICAGCGRVMVHSYQGRAKYVCAKRYYDKNSKCVISIRDEDLEEILLELIREKIEQLKDLKEILEKKEDERKKRIQSAYRKLDQMHETITRMEDELMESYEAYREGKIEKETYIQQKELFEEMQGKLHENYKLQRQAITLLEEKKILPDNWNLDKNLEIKKLDRLLIDLFVKKIIVDNEGHIEIVWNIK